MSGVRAKKHLGQHFLKDRTIAQRIVEALKDEGNVKQVLEIGPGTGVLTDFILQDPSFSGYFMDVDQESIAYLKEHYPAFQDRFLYADFLKQDLHQYFSGKFLLIGNFPYNISSQIFFKALEYKAQIPEIVGMLQKEVAERLASPPGSKQYGILSVLLQTFYEVEYLFTVEPGAFLPPPKVRSGVIRLVRNERKELPCAEAFFFRVVKQSFQMRRKTLRNSLKPILQGGTNAALAPFLEKRAEQLSVEEFILLSTEIEKLI